MTDENLAGASEAGATTRRGIPWGTRERPAKPISNVSPVPNLADLTKDWTNDEKAMEIKMYFDPATSNLSMSYNICGLQPVIREVEGTNFLLKDENDNFYRWNSEIPGLYRLMNATTQDEALDEIIYHPILMEIQRVGHNALGVRSSG
ncbi:hypothetical protein G7Z17_g524 [Cylindrodendrum hubeiense]|uniref:Uncharacterized protein n=1 Tax=Cylindrodendrum hubeiense TaxID=595255 RepID=A0A9P5HRY2_9HYPO|nr:hypothetical protein G7Z17_g524 [Cylindrodendrum hubeiense]